MSSSGAFEVKGLKELTDNLKKVPQVVRTQVVRKASYKCSSIPIRAIRAEIEAMQLVDTGTMKKRIGSKVVYRKRTDQVVLIVGALITAGKTSEERAAKRGKLGITRDPFYIRFHELGTKYLEDRHFVRAAFLGTREQYAASFVAACQELIPKYLEKHLTKAKMKK